MILVKFLTSHNLFAHNSIRLKTLYVHILSEAYEHPKVWLVYNSSKKKVIGGCGNYHKPT